VTRSLVLYSDAQQFGGAERALLASLEQLDRGAWSPSLLIDAAASQGRLAQGARALDVPILHGPALPLGLAGARRVPGLAQRLRAQRADVFHAHLGWPLGAKWALAAAVLARVPATVATVHLIPPGFELDRSSLVQLRALAAGVGRQIAVSRAIARELVTRFGWPQRKVTVIPNAVAAERFDDADGSALRMQLAGDRPLILTCARLDPQKDHATLLAAATELPEAVLALAGDGPERGALEQRAAELGVADRVRFLGFRKDIPELLAACDVFALPSLYEGNPIAVLEAMAAGRAIVTSAIPGTDEVIDDGRTGRLVPPGDAAALAGALRGLLDDPHERAQLGARARECVRREFSPAAISGQVTAVYEELLAGG
jgi:glycosyltransferase involved in cell wall biosynthesis